MTRTGTRAPGTPLTRDGAVTALTALGYEQALARTAVAAAALVADSLRRGGWFTLSGHEVTCANGTWHVRERAWQDPGGITEAGLAAALDRMILSPESGTPVAQPLYELLGDGNRQGWLVHNGALVAAAVFRTARMLQAEAARWVTGALYQSDGPGMTPDGAPALSVYLREEGGWFAYGCGEHFRDGSLDTARFRRLVPEEAS